MPGGGVPAGRRPFATVIIEKRPIVASKGFSPSVDAPKPSDIWARSSGVEMMIPACSANWGMATEAIEALEPLNY
jgi:hypothetical protein